MAGAGHVALVEEGGDRQQQGEGARVQLLVAEGQQQQLADQGDGFYAYVDTDDEAERLLEDELTSTLLTVAKDAKIQVEFDEEVVEGERLYRVRAGGWDDRDSATAAAERLKSEGFRGAFAVDRGGA